MTNTLSNLTDRALVRMSEEDLMHRRRKVLQALEKTNTKGEERAELERVYQALEAEYNRRMKAHI